MQITPTRQTLIFRTTLRRTFLFTSSVRSVFGLSSGFLVLLMAATLCLAPHTPVLAQQSGQTRAQVQRACKALVNETNLNQNKNAMNAPSTPAATETTADEIRPFHVHFPKAALEDLRRRIAATKWAGRETVTTASQGVQLATMQKLARYCEKDYDWRKFEARLTALPQFITEIDGLDIHFYLTEEAS